MKTTISNNYLTVEGSPFYLRGGEIHYFRLKQKDWRERVEILKKTHMNTVSTYMPWFWHEPEEGNIDLKGKTLPERNLQEFLQICADAKVKVIARPGPFINSELREGGYPRWLFEKYPKTLSRKRDGNLIPGRPVPAEGEPELRTLVKRWYSRIIPLLTQFSCEKGGPIILFQPDNELSAAWSYGLGNSLYDEAVIKEGGLWHLWLRKRYGELPSLSERYGRRLDVWADIRPPRDMPQDIYEYRMTLDWMDFKREFFAEWGITLCKWAKEFGINLPMIFNEPIAGFYTHGDHPGFASKMAEAGIDGFTTCHTYSDRIYDLQGANTLELAVEITKAAPIKTVPMSLETNNTWFESRLSRNHINTPALLRMGLAHGLNGSNIYAFAAGMNPKDSTLCGLEYWEDAAVAINGTLNTAHSDLLNFYSFVSAWEREILETQKQPSVLIGITPAIRYIPFLGAPTESGQRSSFKSPELEVNPEPGAEKSDGGHEWLNGYEGVSKQEATPEGSLWNNLTELMILLRRMNIMWGLVDMTYPCVPPGEYTLIVPCAGYLEKTAIDYLMEHLDKGGKVLFFPTIPQATSDGYPDTRLTNRLNTRLTDKIRPAGGRILDYGWRIMTDDEGNPVGEPSWIFLHESKDTKVFASFEGSPVISALKKTDNRILLSGISPSFHNSSHLRLWEKVFSFMEIYPQVEVLGDYMNVVIRCNKRDSTTLLSLCNITGTAKSIKLSLRERQLIFPKDCSLQLAPCEARMLWINLPVNKNNLLYITHEILPKRGENLFEIRGTCGDTCEFAFEKDCRIQIDGAQYTLKEQENHFVGTFRFKEKTALLYVENPII